MIRITKTVPGAYLFFVVLTVSMVLHSCIKEIDHNGFNPNGDKPLLVTSAVREISQTTATGGGEVIYEGKLPVLVKGVCWSPHAMPTLLDEHTEDSCCPGSFKSHISGLLPNSSYYVRAYATDSSGTFYGNTVRFTTASGGSGVVTDIDGNLYHSASIGNQVWLLENLKVTHFRNGDVIPNIINNNTWASLVVPAWSSYQNDPLHVADYGLLYNWHVVSDSRGIAPQGWHIATESEWNELIQFLGGNDVAGGKLKEAGLTHWASPNTAATNAFGFTALPAGLRHTNGLFSQLQYGAFWWVASTQPAYYSVISLSGAMEYAACDSKTGLSLRCIKD